MTAHGDTLPRSPAASNGAARRWLRDALDQVRRGVAPVTRAWQEFLDWLTLLVLIRFSLVLAMICALVLFRNDQSQDLLRGLAERPFSIGYLSLPVAALLCAWIAWYTTRLTYAMRFPRWPATAPGRFPLTRRYLPRLLGASSLGLTGLAALTAAIDLDGTPGGEALYFLTAILWILAIGFVFWARRWDRRRGAVAPGTCERLSQLPSVALVVPGVALLGLALIWLFRPERLWLAQELGTATIVYLAAATLIASGSIVVLLGTWLRLPLVEALVALMATSSAVTDNHLIRIAPGQASHDNPLAAAGPDLPTAEVTAYGNPPAAFDDLPTLERYVGAWLRARTADRPGPVPVIVVAAEGGGQRAAFWTALVLAHLQEADPEFARHVLAISAVSGGSLGAATFAALLADGDGQGSCAGTRLTERVEAILGRDFLAPPVAGFLFRDLPQRLIPVPLVDDRGVALEKAFEAAWRACQGTDRFARPFVDLWDRTGRFDVPLLFLNSTLVETGQRVIATPLPFDVDHRRPHRPCGRAFDRTFNDAWPAACLLGYRLPLSTAVHNSARFIYLSPAGTIPRHPDDHRRPKLHLVDGGYFENSGAVTAYEILRAVEAAAAGFSGDDGVELLPIVIQISNDPIGTNPERRRAQVEADQLRFLTQVRAPIRALLNVRPARGYQARESLRTLVLRGSAPDDDGPLGGPAIASVVPGARQVATPKARLRWPGVHVHFRLCREAVDLPLGWVLSPSARREMRRQLGLGDDGPDDSSIVRIHRQNVDAVLQAISTKRDSRVAPTTEVDPWSCPA